MIAAIAACIAGLTLTLAPSLIIVTAALAIEASGILVAHACAGSRVSAAGMYICSYYICGTVAASCRGCSGSTAAGRDVWVLVIVVLFVAGSSAVFRWDPQTAAPDPIPL
jgi:hypothetical protein